MNGTYQQSGVVWSSDPATPYLPGNERGTHLAIAAAIGVAGTAAAVNTSFGRTTLWDAIRSTARLQGNLSPLSLLNTFRVSEWMSPLASPAEQEMTKGTSVSGSGQKVWQKVWGSEYFEDRRYGGSTIKYLEKLTGKDLTPLLANASGTARLVFERPKDSTTGVGSLYLERGGKVELLSDNVQLFARDLGQDHLLSHRRSLNTALHSVVQQMGLTELDPIVFRANDIFQQEVGTTHGPPLTRRADFVPIPSLLGGRGGLPGGVFGALGAFGMERFNRLLEATVEQFPVAREIGAAAGRLGFEPRVRSGPAHTMFMRFGAKAAGLGAIGLGVGTVDWVRRQGGLPTEIAASGVMSVGVTAVASRLTRRPATAMFIGVGSFFGQTILPGFDQGIIQGVATSAVSLDIAASAAGTLTGASLYRRTLEGLFPGISDWKTGALLGLGAVVASHSELPRWLVQKHGWNALLPAGMHSRIGIDTALVGYAEPPTRSTRSYFYEGVERFARSPSSNLSVAEVDEILKSGQPALLKNRHLLAAIQLQAAKNGGTAYTEITNTLSHIWEAAEEEALNKRKQTPLYDSLIGRLRSINNRYAAGTGLKNATMRFVESSATKAYHAFMGANLGDKGYVKRALAEGHKTRLGRIGMVFGAAFGLHALATKGIFGSMEGPLEKADIYRGRRLVEVGKSRWWEGGGTPFEGSGADYYRPSQYALFMNRAHQRAVWGEDEDKISPIGKFIRTNFTYGLEKKNYYTRPYPISSAAFENVPVVGGLLSATIGKILKPARLMHVSDWIRETPDGRIEYASRPSPGEPNYELGGLGAGAPQSPHNPLYLAGSLNYQFNELEGMTGWAKNLMTKIITGSENFGVQRPVLASAAVMTSPVEVYWDLALGGLFGTTEALRRFVPRQHSEIQESNPILNSMPSWIPERFHYGDPYRKVEAGEVRLPGAGYAAVRPELRGVDPENYPLIHRYAILSDIAPNSSQYFNVQRALYGNRQKGLVSESEARYMDYIDKLRNSRDIRRDFGAPHEAAIEIPYLSRATQSSYMAAQKVVRGIAAPGEYLMPMGFRPVQKLMSNRDAVEQYEYERMYGTPLAFWNKPIRDWFRPSVHSVAHFLGWDGKPGWRKDADEVGEYFDKLEFMKWMNIAEQAGVMGDGRLRRQALNEANKTRHGVNPMGNPMAIYSAMTPSEQKFFDAFTHAPVSDRERILEMVPADQAELYKTIWGRLDRGDPTLNPWSSRKIDETHLQKQYANLMLSPIPAADWIGWNQDVDMSDIKLKYIDRLGSDIHEHDMWESQQRMLARKPYLQGSEEFLLQSPFAPGRNAVETALYGLTHSVNTVDSPLTVHSTNSMFGSRANIQYDDNRLGEIMDGITNALAI